MGEVSPVSFSPFAPSLRAELPAAARGSREDLGMTPLPQLRAFIPLRPHSCHIRVPFGTTTFSVFPSQVLELEPSGPKRSILIKGSFL